MYFKLIYVYLILMFGFDFFKRMCNFMGCQSENYDNMIFIKFFSVLKIF